MATATKSVGRPKLKTSPRQKKSPKKVTVSPKRRPVSPRKAVSPKKRPTSPRKAAPTLKATPESRGALNEIARIFGVGLRTVNQVYTEKKGSILNTLIAVRNDARGTGRNPKDKTDLTKVFVDSSLLKTKLNTEQVEYTVGYFDNAINKKLKAEWDFGKITRWLEKQNL